MIVGWYWRTRKRLLDLRDSASSLHEISIEDLAAALAQLNRWGGRVPVPYNVARHSVDTVRLARADGASREIQYECLMHDVTEAFVGDVCAPIKAALPDLRDLERNLRARLAPRWCLALVEPPVVHEYDQMAAKAELEYVRSDRAQAQDWRESRDLFVRWYYELAPRDAPR